MIEFLVPTGIITLLLLLNALFVAAEFALIGVPRATVEKMAAAGDRPARLLAGVLTSPRLQDQYIATAQLGITVASLGLGMYGEHVIAAWIEGWLELLGPLARLAEHSAASILSVVILTFFHIVVGEMVPKTLALQHAVSASLWITPLMNALRIGMFPLVVGLNGFGNLLLRFIGIKRVATSYMHSPEELELIIEESERGGALDESAADLMMEVLALRDKKAGEMMVPRVRVTGLHLHATPDEMREVLAATGHTRYPIYEESLDSIAGVVHVKDLARCLAAGESLSRDYIRSVPFVPETMAVDDVVAAMRTAEVQMAVVMDEHGGTAGILTEKDLLDELIGEIHEDSAQGPIWRDRSGRVHALGTVLIRDLGEHLELDVEHESVDTLSGLVLALLERPPEIGDTVEYQRLLLTVETVLGHGVGACTIEVLPPSSTAPE